MPYKSDSQRKFFHTAAAKEAGISTSTVKEYDKASKGKDLPAKTPAPSKPKQARKKQDIMTKIKERLAALK